MKKIKIEYNDTYHKDKFNKLLHNEWFYRLKSTISRINYFDDYNANKAANNKVLDFGSGIGQNTAWIKNKFAYDINKNLCPYLHKKGFKTFNSEKEISNNFFDDILISQCLEHLDNPMETLKMLHRKLKTNGVIRVVVPHVQYDVPKVLNGHNTDGHLQNWSFYELNYLLNRCGFEVIKNKKIYRRGTDSYARISKYNFRLYMLFTKLLGKFVNEFDIVVIARKILKWKN